MLLIILVLAYGTFQGLHAWRNSYVCLHQTIRAYPFTGSSYHAELYTEACSDFGAWGFTAVRLVKPGLFGTKLRSKKDLFVFDDADLLDEPTMRWVKPDVLEVYLDPKPIHTLGPPVEEMDGIKIIYHFGNSQISNPPGHAPRQSAPPQDAGFHPSRQLAEILRPAYLGTAYQRRWRR